MNEVEYFLPKAQKQRILLSLSMFFPFPKKMQLAVEVNWSWWTEHQSKMLQNGEKSLKCNQCDFTSSHGGIWGYYVTTVHFSTKSSCRSWTFLAIFILSNETNQVEFSGRSFSQIASNGNQVLLTKLTTKEYFLKKRKRTISAYLRLQVSIMECDKDSETGDNFLFVLDLNVSF